MAWNTPGSGSGNSSGGDNHKPNPWKPKGKGGDNGFDGVLQRFAVDVRSGEALSARGGEAGLHVPRQHGTDLHAKGFDFVS